MRRSTHTQNRRDAQDGRPAQKRRLAAAIVLTLAASACTITAPRIVIEGAAVGAPGSAPAPGATAPGGSSTDPGGVSGPAAGPVSGLPGVDTGPTGAVDTSCLGKATDVGVTASKIRLGSTFAISGPISNISGPILKGVQAYINEVNATGGVHGRKIDFKFYDDGWDAQRGKAKIKQLVEQDKVFMLVSVPSSNGLDAAAQYLDSKRVPVLGTTGLIETQFKASMQWPIGTSTRSSSRIALLDMTRRLKVKTIALIWLDLLAGFEARESIKKGLADGLGGLSPASLVADRRIGLSEPSFEQVWNDVQNQARQNGVADGRPDFVVLAIDPTNAIKALQAARNLSFRPKLGWGGGAPLFLDLVLRESPYAVQTGLYAGTAFFPPIGRYLNEPGVQQYVKTVRKYFADVDLTNPYLEGGYAGAALAVDVLRKAGSCLTRAKVVEAANSLTNYSAANLTRPLTYRPLGVASQHYGNTYGLIVQAVPKGTAGCTRSFGCWNVVPASASDPFYKDPTPGR